MTTEDDRTEVIETTPPVTEVRVPPRRPVAEYDRQEAVAYDPYESRRLIAFRVVQFIYLLFGLIEGLIAIRFVLRALAANPSAPFAEFIYGITAPLVVPFVGLFGNPRGDSAVLEFQSVVALIVYALLAWLLGRLVWVLVGETRSAISTRSSSIDTRS
jgi:uncharacterized membrane protein